MVFQASGRECFCSSPPRKDSYETIIDFFSFTGTVFNIMTVWSVVVLRKKYPDAARPYRAWCIRTASSS